MKSSLWKAVAVVVPMLFAAVGVADAVVFTVPGCPPGTFSMIARTKIGMEQGATKIDGNVLVTKDDGLLSVGAHNEIHGTAIASKIFLGTASVVDNCIADSITGPGTCTNVLGTFAAAPAACKVFDFVPPVVDLCVNTALLVNVPAGQTETLAPGCYGIVRVGLGATLNLEPGVFFIRTLRVLHGGSLTGAFPGPRSRLLVKGEVVLESGSNVSHLDVAVASVTGEGISIGAGVDLVDVQAVSAGASLHLRSNSTGENSAVAAVRLVVEPVAFPRSDEPPVVCECPPGYKFEVPLCLAGLSCGVARSCVPE